GIAVALEFSGPLLLCLAGARGALGCGWVGLAGTGWVWLMPRGGVVGRGEGAFAWGCVWQSMITYFKLQSERRGYRMEDQAVSSERNI
ncbi:hypothetical protein LW957_17565, partial [Erwinia amylovora]|nr:hypothetical protein [Erwinia amylovora]